VSVLWTLIGLGLLIAGLIRRSDSPGCLPARFVRRARLDGVRQ